MIPDYSNHAANERTYLAWVRTGVAIIGLGFVIEKFNLFMLTITKTLDAETFAPLRIARLSGPLGRYGGPILVYGGVALIVLATLRFIRTERLLSTEQTHPAGTLRPEFVLLIAVVLAVAGFSAYLALG